MTRKKKEERSKWRKERKGRQRNNNNNKLILPNKQIQILSNLKKIKNKPSLTTWIHSLIQFCNDTGTPEFGYISWDTSTIQHLKHTWSHDLYHSFNHQLSSNDQRLSNLPTNKEYIRRTLNNTITGNDDRHDNLFIVVLT